MPPLPRPRSLARALCLGTLAAGAGLSAQAFDIVPLVQNTEYNYLVNIVTARFAYFSGEAETVTIAFGANNFFTPPPAFRAQTTTFLPGLHLNAFTVSFPASTFAEWNLAGTKVRADLNAAASFAENFAFFGTSETANHDSGLNSGGGVFKMTGGGTLIIATRSFDSTRFENTFGTVRLTGATLHATTSFLNSGVLRFEGGAIETPQLVNTGRIEFASGAYELPSSLTNRGLLVVSGGSLATPSALALDSLQTLRLTGGTFTAPSINNTGGTVELDGGKLVLTNQSLTASATGPLGAAPVLGPGSRLELTNGQTSIAAGQSLTVATGASLLTQGGANSGDLHVAGGAFESASGAFTNQAGGAIHASAATLTFTGDGVKNTSDGLQNLGTLNLLNTTVHGDVHSPAGSTINAGGGVTFTGLVSGAGAFTGGGTVTFAGGYSPGDSPAIVQHAGDLVLASTNTLTMELAGLAPGTGHDQLVVFGALVFGGTLRVELLDGFTPSLGDVFDLFDFTTGNSSGMFASFALAPLAPSLAWDTSSLYDTGELRVVAVPEPAAAAALLGFAALGVVGLRRRRERA